jgi:hypothetical protein
LYIELIQNEEKGAVQIIRGDSIYDGLYGIMEFKVTNLQVFQEGLVKCPTMSCIHECLKYKRYRRMWENNHFFQNSTVKPIFHFIHLDAFKLGVPYNNMRKVPQRSLVRKSSNAKVLHSN